MGCWDRVSLQMQAVKSEGKISLEYRGLIIVSSARFLLFQPPKQGKAAFEGIDGILGLGYSTQSGSASLLKTLSQTVRSAWGLVQPDSFRQIRPLMFALVVSQEGGELQLGGYDPKAAVTRRSSFFVVCLCVRPCMRANG